MNPLLIIIIILVFTVLGLFGYNCALRVLLKSAHEAIIKNDELQIKKQNDKFWNGFAEFTQRNPIDFDSDNRPLGEMLNDVKTTHPYKRVIKCVSDHNPLNELPDSNKSNDLFESRLLESISKADNLMWANPKDMLRAKLTQDYLLSLDPPAEIKLTIGDSYDGAVKVTVSKTGMSHSIIDDGVDTNEAPEGFIAVSSESFTNTGECEACQAQNLCWNNSNWGLNNPCVDTSDGDMDGNPMPARKDKRDVIFLRKD